MPGRPADFDYQEYLGSREWAILKEKVRDRSKGWCERCWIAPYQNTHHITYERVGQEQLTDLAGLCRPCHAFLSAKSNIDPCLEAVLISEPFTTSDQSHHHLVSFKDMRPRRPGMDRYGVYPFAIVAVGGAAVCRPCRLSVRQESIGTFMALAAEIVMPLMEDNVAVMSP